ncbi:hypothetical protein Tco_1489300 [Tanacetum coccineum]
MPPKRTTTPMSDVAIKSNRNGDGSHDSGSGRRRPVPTTHECTYSDFLKCQPLNIKGTEGVVGLTQWFEKMESVFHISNCTVACQIKFATCTLLGSALTWWNSHVKTVGHDAAYGLPWKTLMKMMTDKYCPRSKIKKLEIKIWNLKVKGTDVVEKYVGELPDMIQGSVMASKPKIMQEASEIANDLMDQKVCTFAEKQAENKRRLDNNSSDNNAQQPPFKRQNVARACSVGPSEKKEYAGTLPLCNKCKLCHNGPCTVKCANCNKVGHLTRDCRSPATTTNNQRTLICYECENQGHYSSDCPKIKNRNHGNQTRGTKARGMVYALGGGEIGQDPNNMEYNIDA